jgi:hypothetical protein
MKATNQLTNEELLFGGGIVQDEIKAVDESIKALNLSFESINEAIKKQLERKALLTARLASAYKEIKVRQDDGRLPKPPQKEEDSLWGDWLKELFS